MGQRLNVEIWNNGKVLANAYYHWSAYTESAAGIVNVALGYINSNHMEDNNDLLYAIRILEATKAGLTASEVEYAENLPVLYGATFAECGGRNNGLIGISKEGISETRIWQEGAVYIFLDEQRISFKVFFKENRWDWEKEQREEYDNKDASARNLDVISRNFDDIKFAAWDDFYDFLRHREEPFVCDLERWEVLTPIY